MSRLPSGSDRLITRRTLLRNAAWAGVGVWTAAKSWDEVRAASPNEKLNIAGIGVGGRGADNINGCASENLVAFADTDDRRAGPTFAKYPNAKRYRDYRKMLDELGNQIDAVVVATPDHTHAPAAVMGMKMGKHCYCEKPLAHTVHEVRTMIDLAAKNKLATQMGTQIHAGDNYRRVVELVQSGAIGPVGEVHVWHTVAYGGGDRPTDTPPVPAELDWDLWLGPAPVRPYHPCYLPGTWRSWWDFGCGGLGDFGCHYMDLPFWALKLRHLTSIEAQGPKLHPERTSPGLTVRYEYPARGDLPPVTMTWYDGGVKPAWLADRQVPAWSAAVLFIGRDGMLIADYGKHQLLPEAQYARFNRPEPSIPKSIGHHAEWIRACKTGEPTTCNFDYSGTLAETVLLGNVAYRVGKKLTWDATAMKAVDCPEAEPLLRKSYREGWTV